MDRSYDSLSKLAAVVIYPYDMDLVSFYEFYRMGVPIFMPSSLEKYLFKQGHMQYDIGVRLNETEVYSDKGSEWLLASYSPFNETNIFVTMEQLNYADYFRFPGVVYFDSIKDLMSKLDTTDLQASKSKMKAFWSEEHRRSVRKWQNVLERFFD